MTVMFWVQILAVAFFCLLVLSLEVGFRLGLRKVQKQLEDEEDLGTGAIEAAVFALFGLILAFTYSGGMNRLDYRRSIIVQEANAIGTAYLRIDLLPAEAQPELRKLFGEYVDVRISTFQRNTLGDLFEGIDQATPLQNAIWSKSVAAVFSEPSLASARQLMIPALNDMIDITTTRKMAMYHHLPGLILFLLVSVALISGVMAGHGMAKRRKGRRSTFHFVVYAVVVSIAMYVALDLEYPRAGLITLEASDAALHELRRSMQ